MKKRFLHRFIMILKVIHKRKMLISILFGLVVLTIHGLTISSGHIVSTETSREYRPNLTVSKRRNLLVSSERESRTIKEYPEILNVNICDNRSEVFLVFIINSAPGNIIRRNRIRRTWGSIRNYRGYDMRYAFFLGGMDQKTYLTVSNESRKNDDIVVSGTYKDDYLNMTRKTLFSMGWVRTHCPSASFVIKCDDDAMVLPKNLLEYLLQLRVEQSLNLFAGFREREGATKFGKESKWHVRADVWPADLAYPAYLRGYFVLHSMRVVKKFHEASFLIKEKYNVSQAAHIDDVYVGLLAKDVGVAAEWLPHLFLNPPDTDQCQVWGMIATLYNIKETSKWIAYWEAINNFDPLKHECLNVRKLIYTAGLS
ncbi:beta-1,3-galactosyltransferase 5-like [Lineus longissimus]|uniref:beta-1,3-galactosyltransferase 5-like n=1 Tax=Lineus longissimus TaxID=88925 RepID=UPI00315C9780